MIAKALTPILNVSNFLESIAWFKKFGWKKGFDWGTPPTFGAVCSGKVEIFLCQGAQGGRGNGGVKATFGPDGDSAADKGCGCRSGSMTSMRSTGNARSRAWTSRGRRPTCPGVSGRCMCGTRTAMSSG